MPDLTPEERERIFQEEKARHEAQTQLAASEEKAKAAAKAKAAQPIVWGCLGMVVLMMGFCAYIATNTAPPGGPSKPAQTFKGTGDNGILDSGAANVVVAVDEKAFSEYMDAVIAKDQMGWSQQLLQGRIFLAPKNTKVLVLDSGFTKKKVRILDGDHAGKSGWVPTEFVK